MSSAAAAYDTSGSSSSASAAATTTTTAAQHEMVLGPLGIDPATFGLICAAALLCFVAYLVLPPGARVEYFGAYPKRFAWSSRTKAVRDRIRYGGGGSVFTTGGGTYGGGASISSVPADARSIGISTLDGGASSYTGGDRKSVV